MNRSQIISRSAQTTMSRSIGQILTDADLISISDLQLALDQQRRTSESIGSILVNLNALDPVVLKAALRVQETLTSVEDAIDAAAGARQTLGQLLVHARRITSEQLEFALLKQEREGGKLGDMLMRLGWVKKSELDVITTFQQRQGNNTVGPLQLGNLLVATDQISTDQLTYAVIRHSTTRRKIGEILVESGCARRRQISLGLALQHKLTKAILIALLAFVTASYRRRVHEAFVGFLGESCDATSKAANAPVIALSTYVSN